MPSLDTLLTKKERLLVPSSYDVIGSILIFSNFPATLKKKERAIGTALIAMHKHVQSIYKKTKHYSGAFRTPKLQWIAGKRNKETIHTEHATRIQLNVENVYFSPRMANERKRVFQQIKQNESVLVMFSGSGVFPLVIARNTHAKKVVGIEANPNAHAYALKNLTLNKKRLAEVVFLEGDVKLTVPKLKETFDRIIMPLPKEAELYLPQALSKLKKNGMIHLYNFAGNDTSTIRTIIRKECEKAKRKGKLARVVRCGHYAPGIYRICADIKIT